MLGVRHALQFAVRGSDPREPELRFEIGDLGCMLVGSRTMC